VWLGPEIQEMLRQCYGGHPAGLDRFVPLAMIFSIVLFGVIAP